MSANFFPYPALRTLFWQFAKQVTVATVLTGVIGIALMLFIERVILHGSSHAEIEHLFGNSYLIAAGLATVGLMIILSAKQPPAHAGPEHEKSFTIIGL